MKVNGTHYRSLWWNTQDNVLEIIDQRSLPYEFIVQQVHTLKDFEDAVIEGSAIREKVDCIITRNLKDFKPGRVECFTGIEYLSLISAE